MEKDGQNKEEKVTAVLEWLNDTRQVIRWYRETETGNRRTRREVARFVFSLRERALYCRTEEGSFQQKLELPEIIFEPCQAICREDLFRQPPGSYLSDLIRQVPEERLPLFLVTALLYPSFEKVFKSPLKPLARLYLARADEFGPWEEFWEKMIGNFEDSGNRGPLFYPGKTGNLLTLTGVNSYQLERIADHLADLGPDLILRLKKQLGMQDFGHLDNETFDQALAKIGNELSTA